MERAGFVDHFRNQRSEALHPKVVLADDHELLIDGLKKVLEPEFDVVDAATDGRSAVASVERWRPDVVLLDIGLPLLNGIEAARQIHKVAPGTRIIFVTMQTQKDYVEEAFRTGASGYVLKQAAATELITAIRTVLNGRTYISPQITEKLTLGQFKAKPVAKFGGSLTPRQREVLQLVAEGKAGKEIATILGISTRTVEFHKASIMGTLGLRTTAELTRYALDLGIAGN